MPATTEIVRKTLRSPIELKAEGSDFDFEAVFSTFDVVDLDGDIVKSSAIESGIELPVLWAHRHSDMPVAVGTVSTDSQKAIIRGKFIDSQAGRDARATVKATQGVQELSWAFSVKESSEEVQDGKTVRVIEKTVPHEVSFVLRGAAGPGRTEVISAKGLSFVDESEAALSALSDFVERAKSLSDTRSEKGLRLSDQSRKSIEAVLEQAKAASDALSELLEQDAPEDTGTILKELESLRLRFETRSARKRIEAVA